MNKNISYLQNGSMFIDTFARIFTIIIFIVNVDLILFEFESNNIVKNVFLTSKYLFSCYEWKNFLFGESIKIRRLLFACRLPSFTADTCGVRSYEEFRGMEIVLILQLLQEFQ